MASKYICAQVKKIQTIQTDSSRHFYLSTNHKLIKRTYPHSSVMPNSSCLFEEKYRRCPHNLLWFSWLYPDCDPEQTILLVMHLLPPWLRLHQLKPLCEWSCRCLTLQLSWLVDGCPIDAPSCSCALIQQHLLKHTKHLPHINEV